MCRKRVRGQCQRILGWVLATGMLAHGVAACHRTGRAVPQQAIDRAVGFLADRQNALDPVVAMLLEFVRRKFDLAQIPSQRDYVEQAWRTALANGTVARTGDTLAALLGVFRRLIDPSARATVADIEALRMPIDQITAMALHCDTVPLPADYLKTLDEMVHLGGYALTHAVLAGEWAIENGCIVPTAFAEPRARSAAALVAQVEKERDLLTDRRMEAMVMLFFMGEGRQVPDEWIALVLRKQLGTGAWPAHSNQPTVPNDHTTVLGLWLLLEAQHEGMIAPVPMVPPAGR